MNEREVLGKNIRRHREYRGLKKEELADKIKVSAKTIERLELGKELTKNFGLNHLFNICKTLDVTLEELVIKDSNLLSLRFVISEHNISTLKEVVKMIKDLIESK